MNTMDELTTIGVELTFEVHRLLSPSLEQALETNFANIMHGIKTRMNEERWRPYVLESDNALSRLLEELNDINMNVEWTKASETSINVSSHAIHFARVAYSLSRDFVPFFDSPLFTLCEKLLKELWMEYLHHLSNGVCGSPVFAYSCTYILTQVLPLSENTFWGEGSDDLSIIIPAKFPKLVDYAKESEDEHQDDDDEEVAHV